jgi:hypothetical protein
LGFDEGNDGEAADSNEGGILEELIGFDLPQGDGLYERFPGLDLDGGIFGIGSVHRDDSGGADGAVVVASFVDDQSVSRLHPAKILHGDRIRNAVPDGDSVALEVGERIFGRFGFEQIV